MSDRFAERRAIVTGGASGIGLAVATRIAHEGGQVALWDVDARRLETARAMTNAAYAHVVDVADAAAVDGALAKTVGVLGGLDVLVTCAGILGPVHSIDDFPLDAWRKVMSINLDGVFHCCRAAVPHMRASKYGRIVTVSSVVGKEGVPGSAAYASAKAAVMGLTKTLGKELAAAGILVNTITPGLIGTPMTSEFPPDVVEQIVETAPLARQGTPEECAAMICFMASQECSFTTGSVFDLSGGRSDY